MTKQEEYFKKIYCTEVGKNPEHKLPEKDGYYLASCGLQEEHPIIKNGLFQYLKFDKSLSIWNDTKPLPVIFWLKPIPVQPVLSFEEFCIWQNLNYDHIKCNSDQYSCEAEIKYKGYLLGCNQPPLEGDVRDAKELIYKMFDDMFKSFDKSIAQKIKQVAEDGDGEVPHSAYWKSCGLYDSKAIVKRLFANSVNNDRCKPLFALLSKYNFTRKG